MTRREGLLDSLYHAHKTNRLPAEGAVSLHLAKRIAQLPPDEQAQAMAIIRDANLAREGFREPFKPAIEKGKEIDVVAKAHGLGSLNDDSREFVTRIFDAVDQEEVTAGLMQRLGTDVGRPETITLRDQVAAAVDAATGSNE